MLNTNGTRRARATAQPARPEGQRRRHGQHDVGPGRATIARQRGQRGEPAEGHGPGRDVALVGGERVDPGDAAPGGVLVARPAGRPSPARRVVLVPGQRGDDVEPVAAARPARSTMLVMTSPVGATSGAKWGQRTTMFTRRLRWRARPSRRSSRRMRCRRPGRAPRPTRPSVKRGGPRAARRATRSSRSARRRAARAWLVAQPSASSGRAARRRRPPPRAGRRRRRRPPGTPAAMASSAGMPKPS